MKKNIIYWFCYLIGSSGLFSQSDLLPLKELVKEPVYQIGRNKYSDDIIMVKDVNLLHPEVRRLIVKVKLKLDEPINILPENFPNVQELSVMESGPTFPTYVCRFKKLEFLYISTMDDDFMLFNMRAIPFLTFPDAFFSLENLKDVSISSYNCIYVPERIKQLKKLHSFKIANIDGILDYQLCFAPISPAFMSELNEFSLDAYNIDSSYIHQENSRLPFYAVKLNEEESFWKSTHKIFNDSYRISREYYNYDWFTTKINPPCKPKDYPKRYNNLRSIKSRTINTIYPNGIKSIEGQVDSILNPDGEWKFYYANGKLKQERYYKNGKEIGAWKLFDSLGNKLAQFNFLTDSTAHFSYFFANGNLSKEIDLKNNIIQYQKWYNNGVLRQDQYYDKEGGLNGKGHKFELNTMGTLIYENGYLKEGFSENLGTKEIIFKYEIEYDFDHYESKEHILYQKDLPQTKELLKNKKD